MNKLTITELFERRNEFSMEELDLHLNTFTEKELGEFFDKLPEKELHAYLKYTNAFCSTNLTDTEQDFLNWFEYVDTEWNKLIYPKPISICDNHYHNDFHRGHNQYQDYKYFSSEKDPFQIINKYKNKNDNHQKSTTTKDDINNVMETTNDSASMIPYHDDA